MLKEQYYLTYKMGKKKLLFSPPICIQMSNFYLYLLSICIQILQLSLKKNTKLLQKQTKKKKNPLPHVKTTHSYPEISMVFFF